jgi:predicted dehydrogenase
MSESRPLRFGILGAAAIAPHSLVAPATGRTDVSIVAIAARDPERARRFAGEHGVRYALGSYRAVIEHPDVDAIYNPLPISHHYEWTLAALAAGKHVLCEKSFSSNAAEAEGMARAAESTRLVLMDAFHYRYHPMFMRGIEIVRSRAIGDLVHVDACFQVPVTNPADIRMNYETAGGVTMDIGCYPISWVRHITGEEPDVVSATAVIGPPDVDVALTAVLRFPSGCSGEVTGSMQPGRIRAELTVTGTKGKLKLVNPVAPQLGHAIELTIDGTTTTETVTRRPTYAYQLDAFVAAVRNGAPLLTGTDDAIKQMRVVDACYRAAGMRLRGEDRALESAPTH